MSRNLDGIITVDQLREEIGDPTTSPQFAGHITDSMLQGVIDNHVDWLEQQTYQRIQEGSAKPIKRTDPVEVSVSQNSRIPELASGNLHPNYFPYATEGRVRQPGSYEGKPLDYRPRLSSEARKIWYDEAFMFDIEDRNVLVYPKDVEEITIFLPTVNHAVQEVMSDMMADVNNNIINRARKMVQARTEEFAEPAYAGGSGAVFSNDD